MSTTCKTCRHWDTKHSYSVPDALGFHDCNCPKIVYSDDCPDKPSFPSDMAVYTDYEGYAAGFTTGPDFGCIHWEAK
jgi:hypothetical protein